MDDPLLVRRLERFGDLARDREGLVQWQRTLGKLFGECRPGDELHDERARALRLLEAEDRRDVRVMELREELRFTLEASQALGVGGELGGRSLSATSRPSFESVAR